jgi:hypothetical protein
MSEDAPINPRQALELKKQKQKEEEEENFTYTPKIKAIPIRRQKEEDSEDNVTSSFDRLYVDAMKRHIEYKIKEHIDMKPGDEQLTFSPRFQSRSTSSSRGTSRATSHDDESSSQCSEPERGAIIPKESKASLARMEHVKRQQQQEQSTTPLSVRGRLSITGRASSSINSSANSSASNSRSSSATRTRDFIPTITKKGRDTKRSVTGSQFEHTNKMHLEASDLRSRLDKLKQEMDKKATLVTPFTPTLATAKKTTSRSATSSRSSSADPNDRHSSRLSTTTTAPRQQEAIRRLHMFEEQKKGKIEASKKQREEQELLGATFQPLIACKKKNEELSREAEPLHLRKDKV